MCIFIFLLSNELSFIVSSGMGRQLPPATVTGKHVHIYIFIIISFIVSTEMGRQLPPATVTGEHVHIYHTTR